MTGCRGHTHLSSFAPEQGVTVRHMGRSLCYTSFGAYGQTLLLGAYACMIHVLQTCFCCAHIYIWGYIFLLNG